MSEFQETSSLPTPQLIVPAAANVVRLLLRYAAPGIAQMLTRLFFQWSGTLSNNSLNTYAQNVANSWATNMGPNTNSNLSLIGVSANDLTTNTAPVGVWTGNKPGTAQTTVRSAPGVAFVIEKVIPRRQKGVHPRVYLPGMDIGGEVQQDANTWSSTYANTIVTAFQAFLTAISGSNGPTGATQFQHVNQSFYKGHTWSQDTNGNWHKHNTYASPLLQPDVVVGLLANLTLGSQRRRNHQGG